jgi:NADH-quinone oxidoreductase subunit E
MASSSKGGDRLEKEQQLDDILDSYKGKQGPLIPVLQKVQERLGYLSEEAVNKVAKALKVSESEIFGVASFYAQFRFTRPGEHRIKVCLGTACHVRGGGLIMEAIERELGVEAGGTTPDYKFTLERVACFGSCALAPVIVTGKKVHGKMTPAKAKDILNEYR